VPTNPRVLIADDDEANRALIDSALRREGFDTVLVPNGRDALAALREETFDVVLLDVDMPFLDGLRTLREIRSSDRFKTLPVILVTGSIGEADRIQGLEMGADDYLVKPFMVRELAARVRAQLRERDAWTTEVEQSREVRRSVVAALEGLGTAGNLLTLAAEVVERVPRSLGIDGFAILHFANGGARSIASGGVLEARFPPTKPLADPLGNEIITRAGEGPWLEGATGAAAQAPTVLEVAYVPFRLGATATPLGCIVFAQLPGAWRSPLAHRLPDLIDATDLIVVILRPAVERAETADAAITRIQHVIAERAFDIVLQPIVRLDPRETVALEALTRFTDGAPPELQFDEAATLGLGGPLQRATAEAALEVMGSIDRSVALSVNLSADVLRHEPRLPELFAAADRPIIVELTEHERIDDYGAVRAALARLGPGVSLAIDDAGSGYASLRHIFALKPAYVKLDVEWVRQIDADPVRRALVSGLVYFASETGCELIAEGIETEDELVALRSLGVSLGQGYLLGRPSRART
jgi:EAL domain-containing protein (putative c-di-GMP-specific phosphodiesterase class I)/DNA-binding NarL/FixJ family response regulator